MRSGAELESRGRQPAWGAAKADFVQGVASVAFRSRASAKPCNDRLVMSQTRLTARSDRATVVVVQQAAETLASKHRTVPVGRVAGLP